MFKKIIALTMTALFVCGLFVMPASADAPTEVVFQDDMINTKDPQTQQWVIEDDTRIVGCTLALREPGDVVASDGTVFPGSRLFNKENADSNFITYDVSGLEFDKMTIRFYKTGGADPMYGDPQPIKVAYSDNNETYTDFAYVTPEKETINGVDLFTFTFNVIPNCNYIKIYDTVNMTFGWCLLVDFKLERNVIAGTPITNGIEFVEFHDNMENVQNSSNQWVPADMSRIVDYTVTGSDNAWTIFTDYSWRRNFPSNSTAEYITYNLEGLDVNTLTVRFGNGNNKFTVNAGEDSNMHIAYSNDNATWTDFENVQTTISTTTDNSQYLITSVIREIPECKYIKIYENASNTFGSLNIRDFKLSKIYGSIYSNLVDNTEFKTDGIVQSTNNMKPTTFGSTIEGYQKGLTFPQMIKDGIPTANSEGEVIYKVDGIEFNQVKLAFVGGNLPREQFIKVEYSKDGSEWEERISPDRQADWWENGVSTEVIDIGGGWKVTIATINGITDDWKYIRVSGPKVTSSSFNFLGIDLRNNKSEIEVKGTIRDSLTGKTAGETVSGTVAVENYTGKTASTTNILALYKNNSLIDLYLTSPFSLTDEYKETTDNTLSLTLPDDYKNDGTYTLKLFVWDSLTNLKPLYTAK